MKKTAIAVLTLIVAFAIGSFTANVASARAQYKKFWEQKYVKKDSTVPEEMALATAAGEAKCNVCHTGTKSKKDRNAYGSELKKLLDKDVKDEAQIKKAFDDVEKVHSDSANPSSPTYGDLIKQGKLPGGDAK